MAGGNWTQSDIDSIATRPGVYTNFQSVAVEAIQNGLRGTVAIAGIQDWGPVETIVSATKESTITDLFGDHDAADSTLYRQVREAFIGGANKVLAFRMVGANAVKATRTLVDTTGSPVNVIRIDGKYVGDYGNQFTLTIADNAADATKTDIKLYVNAVLVRTWTSTVNHGSAGFIDDLVAIINNDASNRWVDAVKLANGNNDLADITAQALASGANGDALLTADYTAAMDAFELADFNVFATDTVSSTIQAAVATWIQDLRTNEGKKVVAVLGSDTGDSVATGISDAAALDHEGIVYVFPGAKVPNVAGTVTTYNGAQMAARVAGMIAAEQAGGSITFDLISNATDVETRLTNSDVKLLLAGGVLPLIWNGRNVVVERGINTLTTLGTKPSSFIKIAVVLTLDYISNAIKQAGEDTFIGKIPNDSIGRRALLDSTSDFLQTMVKQRAIEGDFTVELDPDYDSSGDQVFLKIGLTPIDTIEKIFQTVQVG